MLILKPRGRGNWRTVTLRIEGDRAAPLLIKVGDTLPLGGVVWRVAQVLP